MLTSNVLSYHRKQCVMKALRFIISFCVVVCWCCSCCFFWETINKLDEIDRKYKSIFNRAFEVLSSKKKSSHFI